VVSPSRHGPSRVAGGSRRDDRDGRGGDDYSEATARVRAACLDLATVLGNLLDSITVGGGLVPSLLIPEGDLAAGFEPHPGTIDLDLGLSLSLLNTQLYAEIARSPRPRILVNQAAYAARPPASSRFSPPGSRSRADGGLRCGGRCPW
jgi:hypothetical protein